MNSAAPSPPPATLLVAAVVVALQGAGLLGLGAVGLFDVVPSRVEVGVSVAAFFLLLGAALIACAWALVRVQGWARGPVMLTQLIQLGIAYNVRDEVVPAVVLAVVAVVALVAMVRPESIAALNGAPEAG